MKQEPKGGGQRHKKFDVHLASPHRSKLESTCKLLVTLPSKSLSKREEKNCYILNRKEG